MTIERKKPRGSPDGITDEVALPVSAAPTTLLVKHGGATTQFPVRRFVGRGWVVLGVCTGVVPLVVDAMTAAWYEYEDVPFDKGERAGAE